MDLENAVILTRSFMETEGKPEAVRGPGELTAGYDTVLREGVSGIRARIEDRMARLDPTDPEDHQRQTYLQALLVAAEGVVTLAERYAAEARRLAGEAASPRRRAELQAIAGICDRVPARPARTFREAVQSLYLYHVCLFMEQNAASYNPGRLDQILFPFYAADLNEGRITPEECQEVLDCLWVKFSEPCLFQDARTAEVAAGYNMFQNVCCGGVTETGEDAVNDLSTIRSSRPLWTSTWQASWSWPCWTGCTERPGFRCASEPGTREPSPPSTTSRRR